MLDKIQNINHSKKYQGGSGSSRTSNFEKYFTHSFVSDSFIKDSLNFSPAALYLAKIKWHLHDIEYEGSEKILIDVFISDFEFITQFDFNDFYTKEEQSFEIVNKTEFGHQNYNTIAHINYVKEQINSGHELGVNSIDTIKEMFGRFDRLKRDKDEDGLNPLLIKELIYGIEYDLSLELKHILNQMYTFIMKLKKFNLRDQFVFKDSVSEIVTIEDIATTYG